MKKTLFEICFGHEELVWHFFVSPEGHLCYRSSPKEEKRWSEPVLLQEDYGGQFAFTLGSREQLHLASTDKENNLWYHHHARGKWDSSLVQNLLPWPEISNLDLAADSLGRVHLLYTLRGGPDLEKWQIQHKFRDKEMWQSFVLEEGLGNGEAKASAAIDGMGNLHVVYSLPKNDAYQLVHRVFVLSGSEWRTKEEIPSPPFENHQPCVVFDKRGNMHLVWGGSDGRHFRTLYNRYNNSAWPEGGWESPGYISHKGKNSYSPYIFTAGDKVIALWQQVDGIFYRLSPDLGKTWESVQQYTAIKNLEEYALYYYAPEQRDREPLTAFGSGAPQIALAAAASLLKELEPENLFEEASSLPVRYSINPPSNTTEKTIPSNAKRFLLGYSDTRLSNRLMEKTINAQENEIKALRRQNLELEEKTRRQVRELNSARAVSEMYQKEARELRTVKEQLERSLRKYEKLSRKLSFQVEEMEQTINSLEIEKDRLQEGFEKLEVEKSELALRNTVLEEDHARLLIRVHEGQQREIHARKNLLQMREEIIKLEAESQVLRQEVAGVRSLLGSREIGNNNGTTGGHPEAPDTAVNGVPREEDTQGIYKT